MPLHGPPECYPPRVVAFQESSAIMRLKGDSIPVKRLVELQYAVNREAPSRRYYCWR